MIVEAAAGGAGRTFLVGGGGFALRGVRPSFWAPRQGDWIGGSANSSEIVAPLNSAIAAPLAQTLVNPATGYIRVRLEPQGYDFATNRARMVVDSLQLRVRYRLP